MTPPFDKILIANRGEIACRIIKTCQLLGVRTVSVFSDADSAAMHVALADEAVHIGPAPAIDSYLKPDTIIAAALKTGAQAIHPGYGFLSENADFAEKCAANGIVFVGPSAEAIRSMGLKGAAKALMTDAGVPVVPGYHGDDQDPDRLLAEAERIGFPLLIKAVAGGGGKGMRIVRSGTEFPQALKAAQREAAGAFGNDVVLLEKFIEIPRHIEVQVFADSHGNAVHLFERDCSLQRRHQKVIEEAPAPDMPETMRAAMGDAAVRAAKAIDYCGAGTIEFIVDVANGLTDAPFYFMEMNTRLQVEHPVTEMITGEDLVEWQLRVAAGDPLPLEQDDLHIEGHAFEARLYAEDPDRDFLPATGLLTHFDAPFDDDLVRIETGVRENDRVSIHYDPMIAKVVTWGEDRQTALATLADALNRTAVAGVVTNLPFLRRIAQNAEFAAGRVDTGFIGRHLDDLLAKPETDEEGLLALAVMGIVTSRYDRQAGLNEDGSPWAVLDGWRPNLTAEETLRFVMPDSTLSVTVTREADLYHLAWDGAAEPHAVTVRHWQSARQHLELQLNDRLIAGRVLVGDNSVTVISDGESRTLERLTLRQSGSDDTEGPGTVLAPMPGKVLDVLVSEGDDVPHGQPLLVLEAMKMEHTLTAPRAGIVERLRVQEGDQVSEGDELVAISDPETGEE